jgi:hypothetical protein
MSAKERFFEKYPNSIFIETGSCIGDGIQLALYAGFKTIYSIELAPSLHQHCVDRYKDCHNVHLIFGDSKILLEELLKDIEEPVTFWLDAHASGGETVGGPITALFKELEAIGKHSIKTHTILIDDIRCWGCNEQLIEILCNINPKYNITFEDGFIPNDILVAKV